MRRRIPVDHIKLIPKFKVNGCIRDELAIDYRDRVRKLPGFANHSGDADLFRKVVHTGAGLIGARPLSPNAPLEVSCECILVSRTLRLDITPLFSAQSLVSPCYSALMG